MTKAILCRAMLTLLCLSPLPLLRAAEVIHADVCVYDRSIVPKAGEFGNVLMPICLSATHIAYASIRMEPLFMILGRSAATAAALAIEDKVPVQKLRYETLRARLLADKQVPKWEKPQPNHQTKRPSGR